MEEEEEEEGGEDEEELQLVHQVFHHGFIVYIPSEAYKGEDNSKKHQQMEGKVKGEVLEI